MEKFINLTQHNHLKDCDRKLHTFTPFHEGHIITCHEGTKGERRYTFTLSLTPMLDVGVSSTPRPAALPPGKQTRYQLYKRQGGPQRRSGQARKISPPPGFDLRTARSVASSCRGYLSDVVSYEMKISRA